MNMLANSNIASLKTKNREKGVVYYRISSCKSPKHLKIVYTVCTTQTLYGVPSDQF